MHDVNHTRRLLSKLGRNLAFMQTIAADGIAIVCWLPLCIPPDKPLRV